MNNSFHQHGIRRVNKSTAMLLTMNITDAFLPHEIDMKWVALGWGAVSDLSVISDLSQKFKHALWRVKSELKLSQKQHLTSQGVLNDWHRGSMCSFQFIGPYYMAITPGIWLIMLQDYLYKYIWAACIFFHDFSVECVTAQVWFQGGEGSFIFPKDFPRFSQNYMRCGVVAYLICLP